VVLKFEQYEKLKSAVQIMPDFIPELKHCLPCWMGSYHQNQLGAIYSPECNPNCEG